MTNQPIKIRNGTQNDLPELLNLFRETIKYTCINDYTEKQIEVWIKAGMNEKKWKEKLIKQYFIVAHTNEEICGFASLEKGIYIDLLYVHKNYLRSGIAGLLYKELEKEVKKLNSNSIYTHASITAKSFFEKMGFKNERSRNNFIEGEILINFLMTKSL